MDGAEARSPWGRMEREREGGGDGQETSELGNLSRLLTELAVAGAGLVGHGGELVGVCNVGDLESGELHRGLDQHQISFTTCSFPTPSPLPMPCPPELPRGDCADTHDPANFHNV
jgi:hypothetical protein